MDVNFKADFLQNTLMSKFNEIFPQKSIRVSEDDEPWFTEKLKVLDRSRKREYFRHQKSPKWHILNKQFLTSLKLAKESYRKKILDDLKTSKPGQWYSKIKRMTGQFNEGSSDMLVEEICELSCDEQAKKIADFLHPPEMNLSK